MNKLLEVELHQYETLVFGKVLHTDESLRDKQLILKNDSYGISSYALPEICDRHLCVFGRLRENDSKVLYHNFSTVEEAVKWIDNINSLIDKINKEGIK